MAKVIAPGAVGLKFWRPFAQQPSAALPDAWAVNDKSKSIILSNDDKTATTVSGVAGIRSTTARLNESAGKYYAEFLLENVTGGLAYIGIKNLTESITLVTGASCHVRSDNGAVYVNNVVVDDLTLSGGLVNGDVVAIAWDSGAQKLWFRRNGDYWGDNEFFDPANNIGGYDCSFAAAEDHALWFATTAGVRVVTLRTEVAEFSYTGPSGFTSWMDEALPVPAITGTGAVSADLADLDGAGLSETLGSGTLPSDAATLAGEGIAEDVSEDITGTGALTGSSSVVVSAGISSSTGTGALVGQASAVSGTGTSNTLDAWNAGDKSANITLSNSDKTATLSAAVTSGVRSTKAYLNGTETRKLYAEFLLANVISGFSSQVGIREVSAALNTSAGSTFQCASNSGNIVTGSATTVGNIGGAPLLDGDVICMAWSPSTERGWFRKNAGLWNNNASADPATNTGGFDISVLNNTDHALLFLAASSLNGAITTIRTEVAEFSYAIPSGFVSWMDETLAATGTGAIVADASVVNGAGFSESVASGALVTQAASASGVGTVDAIGIGSIAAGSAEIIGTGTIAAGNSGALVAQAATVAGLSVSESVGTGALQAGAAVVAGAGLGDSFGSGALLAGAATITAEGVVLEEGAEVGSGALVAGEATLSGEGEVTGEVVVPPIYGGDWWPWRQQAVAVAVEGVGYAILPELEGEAHGVVLAVGAGAAFLPASNVGTAVGAIGVIGRSTARLSVKVAAAGDRGQVGAARAVLRGLSGTSAGVTIARGSGSGAIIGIRAAAIGRHDDDEAAILALLAA